MSELYCFLNFAWRSLKRQQRRRRQPQRLFVYETETVQQLRVVYVWCGCLYCCCCLYYCFYSVFFLYLLLFLLFSIVAFIISIAWLVSSLVSWSAICCCGTLVVTVCLATRDACALNVFRLLSVALGDSLLKAFGANEIKSKPQCLMSSCCSVVAVIVYLWFQCNNRY